MLQGAHFLGLSRKLLSRAVVPRSLLVGAVAALALLKAPACGGDDEPSGGAPLEEPAPPTGQVEVTVTFPSDRDKTAVAALHLWVLTVDPDGGATCAKLIGGDISPYDLSVLQQADVVSTNKSAPLIDDSVEVGPVFIYVEGVDYWDEVRFAGCDDSAEISENSTTSVSVTLEPALVYDCTDPDTEDGAPCDDGDFCTVNETCDDGECPVGVARDCTHLEDECNAGSCNQERGCVRDPLPDNEPCDDGLTCTTGEVCSSGRCVGTPVDCTEGLTDCEVSLDCEEPGGCVSGYALYDTPCEDGDPCTENDYCDGFGSCYMGNPVDCSLLTDQCNVGMCNPTTGECEPDPLPSTTMCNDASMCTEFDYCDGAGTCVGGAPLDCSGWTTGCYIGTCAEGMGCQQTPAPTTTVCSDGLVCTTVDLCDGAGTCVGSAPYDCSSLTDQCNAGTCTEPLGTCLAVPTPTVGCDDGSACTNNDVCDALGVCGGTAVDCSSLTDQCNVGTCTEPAGTCQAVPTPTVGCDDGLACWDNDVCDSSGVCGGSAVVCSGACQTGTCSEPGGCDPLPTGTPCGGPGVCTMACNAAGTCVTPAIATLGALCGAASDCTTTCDAVGACVTADAPDGTTCDDGNAATSNDQCTGGVCAGTP